MKKTIRILILCVLGINLNAIAQFVHPGLSHKKSDLDRMKYQVKAKIEPWYSSYLDLCSKSTASYDYVVQGHTGLKVVYRDSPRTNKNIFEADSRAAYYNALRWYIEGDERYAQKAVECLNAWTGLTYVQHNGTAALTSNMVIIMLEAAELIKNTYSGWSASEIQDFKDMLVYPGYSDTTVLPNENTQGTWYWRAYKFDPVRAGNQELCGIRTTMALGVFLDNKKMFDRAIRYITKQPGRLDDIPFPTGPHIRGSEIERNQYRIAYKMTVETTHENFYGNGALTNYVWENGQCQESSRDQGHTSFGLGVLSSIGEIAWNQGFDLWGSTDSRILLGLEYSLRYNVSYVKSFADQLDPWEPTALSGEFIKRDDATLRTHSLSICPFIDTDVTRLTRGTFIKEDTWELPIAHYVGRGFKTKDEVKWTIRARDYSVQENGRFETGPSGGAYVGFGGLSFRRPDGCYGDPINGFDNYSLPEFRMHEVSTPIEAENFDYSPVSGVDRIYHDLSSSNSGGVYRMDESVDITTCSEGGYALTDIQEGEWITYTVNVPSNGTYDIGIRYASINANGKIKFNFSGLDVTSEVTVPFGGVNSTGLTDWKDLKVGTSIPLEKGVQAMKVLFSGSDAAFELNNITISLVEADPDPVNLAPIHGTASQSIASDPCPYGGCAELAIDGNTDGNFGNGSVSHSDHNVNPKWWQVDLGSNYEIETINIYNRTGYESRLNNFTVEVINTQGAVVYSHLYVDSPKPLLSIATGGVIGSIVKISKTSAHGITLAEVEVYGIDSSVLSTTTTPMDDEVELFPNPTSSSFTLTNCAGTQITIFDTLGKMVHSGAIHSEQQTVDISFLKGGLYFIEIENNGSVLSKKIIKK